MQRILTDPNEIATARRIAHPYQHGRVTLSECQVCGMVEWLSGSSDSTSPEANEFVMFDDHACDLCDSVSQRAPEIYRWTVLVASHQAAIAVRAARQRDLDALMKELSP